MYSKWGYPKLCIVQAFQIQNLYSKVKHIYLCRDAEETRSATNPNHRRGQTIEGEGFDGKSVRVFSKAIVYISHLEHMYILSLA